LNWRTVITESAASQQSLEVKAGPESHRSIRIPVLIALLLLAIGLGAALYLVVLQKLEGIVAE
jgi:uncharacterized protein HemX